MVQVDVGSVLGPASPGSIVPDPYPHVVVDSPYDLETYRRLAETFPPSKWFLRHLEKVENNQAVRIPALPALESEKFSPEWHAFVAYHTSRAFWHDVLRVFGAEMRRIYPDLEERMGRPFEEWRPKVRGAPGDADIEMDVQFVINTPVTRPTSVRPAHVDSERKIFTGLFYMKPEDDPTPGGDLELFAPRGREIIFDSHYTNERDVTCVRRVEYTANRFTAFVNCLDAIHGVTPRPVTDRFRRYINFVIETPFPAFRVPKPPLHRKLLQKALRRRENVNGVTLPPDTVI